MLQFSTLVCEHIWLYCNQKLKGEVIPSMVEASLVINRLARCYCKVILPKVAKGVDSKTGGYWNPRTPEVLKFNSDAVVTGDHASIGIITRNSKAEVTMAYAERMLANSVFEAEAIGILKAMEIAESLHIEKAIFEGNSMNVILALNGFDSCLNWPGNCTIQHVRNFFELTYFFVLYSHVP